MSKKKKAKKIASQKIATKKFAKNNEPIDGTCIKLKYRFTVSMALKSTGEIIDCIYCHKVKMPILNCSNTAKKWSTLSLAMYDVFKNGKNVAQTIIDQISCGTVIIGVKYYDGCRNAVETINMEASLKKVKRSILDYAYGEASDVIMIFDVLEVF